MINLYNKRIKSDSTSCPVFCKKQTAQKNAQLAPHFMRALCFKEISLLSRSIFSLVILLVSFHSSSTTVSSNGFQFVLDNEWVIEEQSANSITAANKETLQVFILSVYKPTSIEQGAQLFVAMKDYLSNLNEQMPSLFKSTELVPYTSNKSVPWELISYSDKFNSIYFIGACLGTQKGVLMVTFEGEGLATDGATIIKTLLDTMSYNET
ncbi:MAG: hypothetical protein ACJASL_005003 [Paraglaciecola sp.]|jgi:hypothetical protein